tara:strand:- start:2748 stop:3092 length:345 start_codon:yes stop_codon:yes gene_type:complete
VPDDCLFCRIAGGAIPTDFEHEDNRVVAFRDINPQAPTHILIVPKRHIATVNDLATDDADLVGHMMLTARSLAENEGIAGPGYRLVVNCNPDGAQSVYHIHLHLMGGRQLRGLG